MISYALGIDHLCLDDKKTIKRIKNTHILNGNESYVNTGVSVELFKNILPERTVNLK